MVKRAKNPNTAVLIQQMPKAWVRIIHELTGTPTRTIQGIVYRYDARHRIWPIIEALASPEKEVAAREVAAKLGWLKQAA